VPASMLKFAGPCKLTGMLDQEKLVLLEARPNATAGWAQWSGAQGGLGPRDSGPKRLWAQDTAGSRYHRGSRDSGPEGGWPRGRLGQSGRGPDRGADTPWPPQGARRVGPCLSCLQKL